MRNLYGVVFLLIFFLMLTTSVSVGYAQSEQQIQEHIQGVRLSEGGCATFPGMLPAPFIDINNIYK